MKITIVILSLLQLSQGWIQIEIYMEPNNPFLPPGSRTVPDNDDRYPSPRIVILGKVVYVFVLYII